VIAERRLAKLEGALSPKAATLLWLEEAHQFRSLPAYVDWLIDQPISAAPLERVPEQARAAVVEALRGQPREAVREASRGAIRDAIFLVELVITLNRATQETLETEGLRYAALFWEMQALTAAAELERANRSHQDAPPGRSVAEPWTTWCGASASLVLGLYVAEEARLALERRYLDGHPALFPEAVEDWTGVRGTAEGLAGLGDDLQPLMGGRGSRRRRSGPDHVLDLSALRASTSTEARDLMARLVDEARAAALDALGDAETAASIAERRLRATMSQQPAVSVAALCPPRRSP